MVSDLGLLFAPERNYGRLVMASGDASWKPAIRRCAMQALLLGTSIVLVGTQQVSLTSVASVTAYWSVVPLLQLALAVGLVASTNTRQVSLARGAELVLAGQTPWTFWLLIITGFHFISQQDIQHVALPAAFLAAAWEAWVLAGFCSAALNIGRRRAIVRAFLHQLSFGILIIIYGSWAVALNARF